MLRHRQWQHRRRQPRLLVGAARKGRGTPNVIEVNYTLNREDGDTKYVESLRSEQVPRIGEIVSFDWNDSYQVVDVLWHLHDDQHVTVTACEVNWHRHINDVTAAWRAGDLPGR